MSDVEQNVVTRFTGEDNISATLARIAMNGTGVSAALTAAQIAAQTVAGPIAYAQQGLAHIIDVQSKVQNTQLELTSSLRAYETFGATSEQIAAAVAHGGDGAVLQAQAFETAGRAATGIMRQITRDAAALPGTAQDYLMVFQQALPAALASTHQQVSQIATLTNHGAAIAIANGIDAAQAGRDMMAMFQGHADTMNRTYQVLGPLMTRSATDHNRLTQQGFNAMNGNDRFLAMQRAINQYLPMLERMGATWSAMTGAWESNIQEMVQGSTKVIFDTAIRVFGQLNDFIQSYSESIINVGKLLSSWAVSGFKVIEQQAHMAFGQLKQMGSWIMSQPWFNQVLNLGTHAAHAVYERTVGLGATRNSQVGMAAAGVGALVAPVGGVMFGSFLHFLENTEAVSHVMRTFQDSLETVAPLVGRIVDAFGAFSEVGGSIMGDVLPALADLANMAVHGAVIFAGTFMTVMTPAITIAGQTLSYLGRQFGALVQELGGAHAVFGFLVRAVATVTGIVGSALVMTLNMAVTIFGTLINVVRHVIHWMSFLTQRRGSSAETDAGHIPTRDEQHPAWLDSILNAINQVDKTAKTQEQQNAGRHQPPTARGGTHQDFRYSRFDITQKFAEGFDPDRIAAVFTTDLEAMANNRLDSGFSPAFGLS